MISAFECCDIFLSLRLHFLDEKYDAKRYNFRTTLSQDSFNERNDKAFFISLAKKYPTRAQIVGYGTANFSAGVSTGWIGDFTDERYRDWLKRTKGLTYMYKQDLKTLQKRYNSYKYMIQGNPPRIINDYLGERIGLETLTILNSLIGITDGMDKDGLFGDLRLKIIKYTSLLNYDARQMAATTLPFVRALQAEA